MFTVSSVILFLLLFVSNSKQEIDSSENEIDLEYNDDSIEMQHETSHAPTIEPYFEEDAKLTTPQLITKYGYEAETHFVTTEDGYIVQLHRIAGGAKSPPRRGKKVCFIMHGLMDSSAGFILTGPKHALGYMLADNDFDVWLGNARGNTYSTNHTYLNPFGSIISRNRYWAFSWHEIGFYDLPASIDYILAKTGESKLQYIGHSQGGTAFFVMAAERPEYNNKIEMMHGLAPAAFLSHTASPAVRVVAPMTPIAQRAKQLMGIHFIRPTKAFRMLAGELLCRDRAPTQIMCENLIFLVMGYDSDQMNVTMLPVIMGHAPAGASTGQFMHYGQEVLSGKFRRYNYGPVINLVKYKRLTPPKYNIGNIKAPVAIYYARNDWLVDVKDIRILLDLLPNLVKEYLVPHKSFNHMDFLWGTDAPILVYDELLKTMKASQNSRL